MKKFSLILGLALFAFSRSLASAGTVTIQNEFLRIDYDDKADSFSVTPVSSGGAPIAAAIKDMSLGTYGPGPATCTSIQDAVFGTGQAIQFGDPMGESAEIELFPGIPFGILKTAWVFNGSKEDTGNHVLHVIERVPVATFFPDLNTSAARLVIRGTGGLHDAQEYATQTPTWMESLWDKFMRRSYHQPGGSYEWLTIADPKTGAGIVAGFLSQNRATGVLKPMFDANGLFVQARNEFGQLQVALGEPVGTETFAFGCFSDVRFGLEKYADVVAKTDKIKLPPQPAGYCTWYAEQHGGSSDEKSLDDLSDFIAKNLQPFGMNFVQIDDGWQLGDSHGNGPNKNFTDSNPKGPYPSGMKATADKIKSDDLTPGLWFIPFGGTFDDPWFADKQDLFMKAKDGKPFLPRHDQSRRARLPQRHRQQHRP
jgi:hypothetical protein